MAQTEKSKWGIPTTEQFDAKLIDSVLDRLQEITGKNPFDLIDDWAREDAEKAKAERDSKLMEMAVV